MTRQRRLASSVTAPNLATLCVALPGAVTSSLANSPRWGPSSWIIGEGKHEKLQSGDAGPTSRGSRHFGCSVPAATAATAPGAAGFIRGFGPVSVSRGAKIILLVLLCACQERSAGSFLSIPGVRSQIVEGEKRRQRLGQEGPGAQGWFRLFEGQPRGLRPGGSARGCVCVMALPGRYGPPWTH